jgi:hypothetical protein
MGYEICCSSTSGILIGILWEMYFSWTMQAVWFRLEWFDVQFFGCLVLFSHQEMTCVLDGLACSYMDVLFFVKTYFCFSPF